MPARWWAASREGTRAVVGMVPGVRKRKGKGHRGGGRVGGRDRAQRDPIRPWKKRTSTGIKDRETGRRREIEGDGMCTEKWKGLWSGKERDGCQINRGGGGGGGKATRLGESRRNLATSTPTLTNQPLYRSAPPRYFAVTTLGTILSSASFLLLLIAFFLLSLIFVGTERY